MINWIEKTSEERALLAPSFIGLLVWSASIGHAREQQRGIPFLLSFLIAPIVLHQKTRSILPNQLSTSLPVWLDESPLLRSGIAKRATKLIPFTKAALLFGGTHDLFTVTPTEIRSKDHFDKRINQTLKNSSDEVQHCIKKAEFLGRWLANSGDSATVMTIFGVKP